LTDDYSEEEFAPIAAAMKNLPSFAPSPRFADKVMARVRIEGASNLPVAAEIRSVAPVYRAPIERRAPAPVVQTDYRRSLPARMLAGALVASLGVTMTAVVLVSVFNFNLFLLISRVFGESTMAFLASFATDAVATTTATATSTIAAAGTASGALVAGSFAIGAVAATAALRAAASASRRAA
jgi:hypothetical protein